MKYLIFILLFSSCELREYKDPPASEVIDSSKYQKRAAELNRLYNRSTDIYNRFQTVLKLHIKDSIQYYYEQHTLILDSFNNVIRE